MVVIRVPASQKIFLTIFKTKTHLGIFRNHYIVSYSFCFFSFIYFVLFSVINFITVLIMNGYFLNVFGCSLLSEVRNILSENVQRILGIVDFAALTDIGCNRHQFFLIILVK